MGMRVALAGFAFGSPSYISLATDIVSNNWNYYAEKHGYDCILFTDLLDPSMHRKSIMMQKMLVFNKLKDYDAVVYLDTDIIINPNAPAFPVFRSDRLLRAVPHIPWEGVKSYSRRFNLHFSSEFLPQGGVLCLSNKQEYLLMEKIYYGKELLQDHPIHAPDQVLVGMPYLKSGRCQWIDQRWNYVPSKDDRLPGHPLGWLSHKRFFRSIFAKHHNFSSASYSSIRHLLSNTFFLHLAGGYKSYIPDAIAAGLSLRSPSLSLSRKNH